jgi:hypothetical protein
MDDRQGTVSLFPQINVGDSRIGGAEVYAD